MPLHWTLGFAVRHGDDFTLHFHQHAAAGAQRGDHAAFRDTSGRALTLQNEAMKNNVRLRQD